MRGTLGKDCLTGGRQESSDHLHSHRRRRVTQLKIKVHLREPMTIENWLVAARGSHFQPVSPSVIQDTPAKQITSWLKEGNVISGIARRSVISRTARIGHPAELPPEGTDQVVKNNL